MHHVLALSCIHGVTGTHSVATDVNGVRVYHAPPGRASCVPEFLEYLPSRFHLREEACLRCLVPAYLLGVVHDMTSPRICFAGA